jgi:hypothetical protein
MSKGLTALVVALLSSCAPCLAAENVRIRVTSPNGTGLDDAMVTCAREVVDVEAVHISEGTWACTGGAGRYDVLAMRGGVSHAWSAYAEAGEDACHSPLVLQLELVIATDLP